MFLVKHLHDFGLGASFGFLNHSMVLQPILLGNFPRHQRQSTHYRFTNHVTDHHSLDLMDPRVHVGCH